MDRVGVQVIVYVLVVIKFNEKGVSVSSLGQVLVYMPMLPERRLTICGPPSAISLPPTARLM